MSQPPKCIDCRHYRYDSPGVTAGLVIVRAKDCRRAVRVTGADPVTGAPIETGWRNASVERSSFWLFWLTYPIRRAKACGPSGRFFSPKEAA